MNLEQYENQDGLIPLGTVFIYPGEHPRANVSSDGETLTYNLPGDDHRFYYTIDPTGMCWTESGAGSVFRVVKNPSRHPRKMRLIVLSNGEYIATVTSDNRMGRSQRLTILDEYLAQIKEKDDPLWLSVDSMRQLFIRDLPPLFTAHIEEQFYLA